MISTEFLLAGNATFTVSNPEGKHYTFKVIKSKSKNTNGKYMFFIKVLTGPDIYTYVGVVEQYGGVRLTKKSKYKNDTLLFKVADWAIRTVMFTQELKEGYHIDHAGKCGKCGRKLTTPESIKSGIGPICGGRL